MSTRSPFRLLSLISTVAIAATVFAQNGPHYSGPEWKLLDPAPVLKEAGQITTTAFPNCDDAIVEQNSVRNYREDGTAESQDETFVKVLTEKGRRRNTTLNLSYQIPYTTVEVPQLEVLKADGRTVPVDVRQNWSESIDDSQMQMNIYDPNSRVVKVNIPDLAIGDVIHSVVRTNIVRPPIAGEYAEDDLFESESYLRHASLVVRGPSSKPLRLIRLRNEVAHTVTATTATENEGHTQVYRWEVNRVPRMFAEPAMPSYSVVLQRLSISTAGDWGTVSRWYWDLSKQHLAATGDELKAEVAQLTSTAKSDLDRIHALFYYVSKNIRYMGITPEKDRPGFEPHDVKITFAKKYGVCRDKAALLVAMLREAGLPAYPVLVSYGTKKDPDVPNFFFNHAIVGVDRGKEGYLLMDPTDENTRDLLPAMEGNQSYLVCRPEGDVLRTTPVNDPDRSMLHVATTGSLDRDGFLKARSEIAFDGVNDNAYRGAFTQMKQEDRWRFFEATLRRVLPGATLRDLKISPSNLLDAAAPLKVSLDYEAPNLVAFGENTALVNLPWVGKGTGIVNFILGGTGLETRRYPMQTYVACGVREDISLQVAPEFKSVLSLPACTPQDSPEFEYNRSYDFRDGKIAARREFKLRAVEFTPEEYRGLKSALASMQVDDRKAPLLQTAGLAMEALPDARPGIVPPQSADSQIEELTKDIRFLDAHSATLSVHVVKRVLNYSGKKKEAEVKIGYNPATESVKVIRATVVSKEGKRQDISPEESNTMDAGWNTSAKRYTGGKILVLSLPGVEIGSAIDLEYEVTAHDKPFIGGFEAFQKSEPCDRVTIRFTAPEKTGLTYQLAGEGAAESAAVQRASAGQRLEWKREGVPSVPSEDMTPPDWCFSPGVSYFVGSPEDYLKELRDVLDQRVAHAEVAAKLARELARGAKTPEDILITIRNRVDRTVRLAGPDFTELPLSELSDADRTLEDGYGHLADRAILLAAMLKAVGFTPEWVLASDLPDVASLSHLATELTRADDFRTPVLRVTCGDRVYLLNDTDQYARLGATPHDGKLGLRVADGRLVTLQAAQNDRTRTEEAYALEIGTDGEASVHLTRRYYGALWGAKKKFYAELPPEERRQHFEQLVSSVAQGARPAGELQTDFDDYPGTETFAVDVDHYAVADGRYLYLEIPSSLRLLPYTTDQRVLPYFITDRVQRDVTVELKVPSIYTRLLMSPQRRWKDVPAAGADVSVTSTDGEVTFHQVLRLDPAVLAPTAYGQLARLDSLLENRSSKLFLFEKAEQTAGK